MVYQLVVKGLRLDKVFIGISGKAPHLKGTGRGQIFRMGEAWKKLFTIS